MLIRDTPRAATWWGAAAALEVLLATAAIVLDLLLPTLVLLLMAAISLTVRRQPVSSLGFQRVHRLGRLLVRVFALTALWTVVQLALIMPVVQHLSGQRQDVSQFAALQGDVVMLIVLLALSWTLAAVGEEVAFRGYLQERISAMWRGSARGMTAAILGSSVLFGLVHTEQGLVGVVITFFDGLYFSTLRHRLDGGLWAAVLAHGFNNTIGLVAFFLIGPVGALW